MLGSETIGVNGSGAGTTAKAGGVATVSATAHLHKCIYEGSKSYWRTRQTVDVRIIEHTDANILEIICFEVESYQDADRLYLNADKLYKKLETPELKEKVEQKREEYARQRKRVPNEEITRTLVREAAVQFVLTRLVTSTTKAPPKKLRSGAGAEHVGLGHAVAGTSSSVDADCTDSENTSTSSAVTSTSTNSSAGGLNAQTSAAAGSNNNTAESSSVSSAAATAADTAATAAELAEPRFAVDLAILTGDKGVPVHVPHASHGNTGPGPGASEKEKEKRLDVFLDGEPEGIEHVVIVRARKKATNKEFNQVLRNLRMDNDMLNKATSDAQRKAGLAVSSVDGFKSFAMRKTFDPKTMSMAQWRWIWAGRRVILQNFVAAVRDRLDRGARKAEEAANSDVVQTPQLAGSASQPGVGPKSRRTKDSNSLGTKLPSLLNAKQSRHSMSSLRRMTRGSKEPREINEFSAAFSGAISAHAEKEKAVVKDKDSREQRASFATLLPELSVDGKIHQRVV